MTLTLHNRAAQPIKGEADDSVCMEGDHTVQTVKSPEAISVDGPIAQPNSSSSELDTEDGASDTSVDICEDVNGKSIAIKDTPAGRLGESDFDCQERGDDAHEETSEVNKTKGPATVIGDSKDPGEVTTHRPTHDDQVEICTAMVAVIEDDQDKPLADDRGTFEHISEAKDANNTPLHPGEACYVTGGGENVTEMSQHQPTWSVPPHSRKNNLSTAIREDDSAERPKNGATTAAGPQFINAPRGPRPQYASNPYQHYRSGGGREEMARMSAQLMKARNELEAERKKAASMRRSVEAEKEEAMDAALSHMTMDLVRKQGEALAQKAKFDGKARELGYREARIQQLEVFLSEGQKQVYLSMLEEEEGRTMTDVYLEHERRQAEVERQKHVDEVEGKLSVRMQGLQLREAAQQMCEQQYKALVRQAIEKEMRDKIMSSTEAKMDEVGEFEYNRGFGAGKEAGYVQADQEGRRQGFLEGYSARHRAEVALGKARKGLISYQDPELDFLYDSSHPQYVFSMGSQIVETEKKKKVVQGVKEKGEEQKSRQVGARATFACELRGGQAMHGGQIVLANSSVQKPKKMDPDGMGQGVYEGRRIKQYEGGEESNLIDLY